MSATDAFPRPTHPLAYTGRSWPEIIFEGDKLWAQMKSLLDANGAELPKTPRFPEVRVVINNISGAQLEFFNVKDHSGQQ